MQSVHIPLPFLYPPSLSSEAMGLSGPRKRAKISHDPNNTAWTRSESRLGQKLLLSQGWTPGSSLGASNASYINNPASMSHIRVTVKDNNRGLGANSGFIDDDRPTPGLDGLQDLLGRLNGKDSLLLQADERSRAGFRTAAYAGKRWGLNTFVSGGFLIGDRLQLPEKLDSDKQNIETDIMNPGTGQPRDHRTAKIGDGKRREAHMATDSAGSGLKALRIQGPEPRRTELTGNDTDSDRVKPSITAENHTFETETPIQRSERNAHRRSRRAEKVAKWALEEPGQRTSQATVQDCAKTARMTHAPQTRRAYGKHVGRQRSIRQKKMSVMDPKALNEILMIRA